jgi:hypothetical protein
MNSFSGFLSLRVSATPFQRGSENPNDFPCDANTHLNVAHCSARSGGPWYATDNAWKRLRQTVMDGKAVIEILGTKWIVRHHGDLALAVRAWH